jgi:hypothetical protein
MMQWMISMSLDQTLATAQEAPTEAIQALVDRIRHSTGTATLMTEKIAMAIMAKQFIEAALAKHKPFHKFRLRALSYHSEYVHGHPPTSYTFSPSWVVVPSVEWRGCH